MEALADLVHRTQNQLRGNIRGRTAAKINGVKLVILQFLTAHLQFFIKTCHIRFRIIDFIGERRKIAIENVSEYSWAESSAQTQISRADKYVGLEEQIYNLFPSQEIPRSMTVGAEGDPEMYYCRYCGTDLQAEYANFPWKHAPLTRPWKIQCPDCKRLFPSNDFESLYKLGLNEYGEFIYQAALDKHRELFGDKTIDEPGTKHSEQWKKYYGYGVESGYLTNILYDDLEDNKTINCGRGLRDGETEAELVSAEQNYTFYAWEKCTVEAVYADDKPVFTGEKRKILVDTFSLEGETAVMAEFIGFDNAVERGITLGSKDYTMTSKTAKQFTIINDVNASMAEISGYAILADGTKLVYNLK